MCCVNISGYKRVLILIMIWTLLCFETPLIHKNRLPCPVQSTTKRQGTLRTMPPLVPLPEFRTLRWIRDFKAESQETSDRPHDLNSDASPPLNHHDETKREKLRSGSLDFDQTYCCALDKRDQGSAISGDEGHLEQLPGTCRRSNEHGQSKLRQERSDLDSDKKNQQCKQKQQQQKQQQWQQQQQQQQQHQQEQNKKKTPGCACQCRMSDRAKSGRFKSRPCRFQWRDGATWSRSLKLAEKSNHTLKGLCDSGKRCRKLLKSPWSVDATPNHKGQAKRNSVNSADQKADLSCLTHISTGGNGHKGTVDLLLMSEDQRQGGDGAGHRNTIQQFWVFLVVTILCWEDLSRQKKTARKQLSLLPRAGACKRTTRMNTNKHGVFFYSRPFEDGFHEDEPDFRNVNKTHLPVVDPKVIARLSHWQRVTWIFPTTTFLPSVSARDNNFLDHVGYRLASLAALPASCNLSRVRLAEAGFHFNPRTNPSAVLCHRCGTTLSFVTNTTLASPLAFHREASPQCPFLRSVLEQFTEMPVGSAAAAQQQNDAAAVTQQSSAEPRRTRATQMTAPSLSRQIVGADRADGRDLSEDSEGAQPAPSDDRQPLPNSQAAPGHIPGPPSATNTRSPHSSEDRPVMELGSAVYPQFSTAQSRLTTFHHWPLTALFLPQTLASMGFYYAGYADCVRCFYCGVGLKSWAEDDDPLVEHVRWRPQCGFLLATKGRQFIHGVLSRIGNTNSQDQSQLLPAASQPQQRQTAASTSTPTSGMTTSASDGQVVSSRSEQTGQSHVRQQLLTMGFTSQAVDTAMAQIESEGGPDTLDNLLARLLPE